MAGASRPRASASVPFQSSIPPSPRTPSASQARCCSSTGQRDVERLELEQWRQEEQRPFVGWDFSYIRGRIVTQQPPWSYADRAAALLEQSSSVLDMGTGGGERFLELRTNWPANVTVTEEYPPNIAVVQHSLGPLGVRVVGVHLTYVHPMP